MPILSWPADQAKIVEWLQQPARMRICTKTLNEALLIEGWIEHHSRIVGAKNLIIADNGSNDPRVREIYEKHKADVLIFYFEGPHNEIHWHPKFAPIFETLRKTCEFFAFFDTDERLVKFEGDRWYANEDLLGLICAESNYEILPTTWLINQTDSFERFSLLDTEGRPKIHNNLRWGKPIMRSHLIGQQHGIHNAQYSKHSFRSDIGTKLLLLHLTQFPARRIAVNRNKLVSRKIITEDTSLTDFLNMDFSTFSDQSFIRFVVEAKQMLSVLWHGMSKEEIEKSKFVKFSACGQISYSDPETMHEFHLFIKDGEELIRGIFDAEASQPVASQVQ